MFGFVAAVVVAMQRQPRQKVAQEGGLLLYPDNSVVTVLFRSQATAITSNLLLFHETTSSGSRQWPMSVFFNLLCIKFTVKLHQNEQFIEHLIFNIVALPTQPINNILYRSS